MNQSIQIYNDIVTKVKFFFKQLKLKINKSTGRPLKITPEDTIALSLFKQSQGVPTKKAIWKIFEPACSYKTLAVNMNRFAIHALLILQSILRWNQKNSHIMIFPSVCRKMASTTELCEDLRHGDTPQKAGFMGLK